VIDTDETGQKKLESIVKYMEEDDLWDEWEYNFLNSVKDKKYRNLTIRQKTAVGNMFEKMEDAT
jgi:hypothetical protein